MPLCNGVIIKEMKDRDNVILPQFSTTEANSSGA